MQTVFGQKTRLDQVVRRLKERKSKLDLLDLRPDFAGFA